MKEIRKQIKEKNFYKVYLLTGDEEYLVQQARHLLKEAMVSEGDEMNYSLYEESKIDFQALAEQAFTFPFFSEKRVIVLDRTGVIKSGKDDFLNILKNLPDTTCILICEPEVDKRSKAYKWIKKNGYVAEFLKKNQTEKILLRWIATLLGKEKKQIREADARYFLERVGNDMFQIKNETDKLIAFCGERGEVTRDDIEQITSGEVQNKIFDMVSAIAAGNKQRALSCYDDLLLLKEAPMHILFLIIRQYRILLIIRNMRNLRKPDAEIAQCAGIPPFAVKKNEGQLRGYDQQALEDSIEHCLAVEEDIKTGRIDDQLGVEMLIVALSERRSI